MVDKFLLENKIEIENDDFTERVMKSLPEREAVRERWQHQLSLIWNAICLLTLILFCWRTNVIDNLWIDTKAFLATLPFNIHDVNIWQTVCWIYATIIALVILIFKKYEKVF